MEIKRFLGLIGFYRNFIKRFAHVTKPFTKCLHKKRNSLYVKIIKNASHLEENLFAMPLFWVYPDFKHPLL